MEIKFFSEQRCGGPWSAGRRDGWCSQQQSTV